MEYLSLKDQADGTREYRGSWEEDQEVRLDLYNRAKAMLLDFEKRRAKLSRTVSKMMSHKKRLMSHREEKRPKSNIFPLGG